VARLNTLVSSPITDDGCGASRLSVTSNGDTRRTAFVALVSEALLHGNNPTVTNVSLSRATICGDKIKLVGKGPKKLAFQFRANLAAEIECMPVKIFRYAQAAFTF
jgi:hypothetical protein